MTRRRVRVNWFWVTILGILIIIGMYVDRFVVPTIPPPFVPTPTPTRSPESFVTEAQAMFKQGKLLQAIDLYKGALTANPRDDAVYVAMAQTQVFAGLYKDAQASAEEALLINPNNSMAHAVRAWALDFQDDIPDAMDSINRALTLDPNNGIAHAYYVEILVDSQDYTNLTKAADESRIALSLAPNTIEANRARGYILEATGNYEEAIQYYQAAVAINDNIPDLHIALGRTYKYLSVYDKAIQEFTRPNALNPSDPTPDLLISRTEATIGEFAKASQYAETAMKDLPTDPSLRGNYGVMLYYNLDWPNAAVQLGLAVNGGTADDGSVVEKIPFSTDTRVVEYYYTYALTLARLNRCNEALQVAQLILSRAPADDNAVSQANKAIGICQSNLSATATPTVPAPLSTVPPVTPSAIPSDTPVPTYTPTP